MKKKRLVWDILQLSECRLFTAWYDKTLIAGNIIFTHNFPFYWLGSSLAEFSKLNAPAILHWNIIEFYQKEGYQLYDLNGAVYDRSHGPTRFKKSMGAFFVEYNQLSITPYPRIAWILKSGSRLYYNFLKRETW